MIAGQGTSAWRSPTTSPRAGPRQPAPVTRRRLRSGQRRRPHLGHRGRGQGPAARRQGHRGRAGTRRGRARLAPRGHPRRVDVRADRAHAGRRAPRRGGRRADLPAHPGVRRRHRHRLRGRDARRDPPARPAGAADRRARRRRRRRSRALPRRDRTWHRRFKRTKAPVVAVLSGGNIDPALLADILQTESYTG